MEHPGLPLGWTRALHQQPGRAGHSHDQSAPKNLRLLPHAERGPDLLSHPQLPEHLSQTRPQPLAGAPERRRWRAFHPLSTQRRTLRPEQLPKNYRRARRKSHILNPVSDSLVINEIYLSLQGEGSFAGWPCIFVRLTACNLRCSYCDTAYAFTEGRQMTPPEIMDRVGELARGFAKSPAALRLPLVELTGGEPLLQKNSLPLMKALCDAGFTVLLETSGAMDIAPVDARVRRIMDLKCPSSGECERNRWENLAHLKAGDEIKFVIGTLQDYEWAGET